MRPRWSDNARCELGELLDPVEVGSLFSSRPGDLEHDEVAGDAAPFVLTLRRRAVDIVGDQYRPCVDTLVAQPILRLGEVQDIARVVAVGEQHPAAPLDLAGHRIDLLRRWRSKQVAHCGAVRQTRADKTAERG